MGQELGWILKTLIHDIFFSLFKFFIFFIFLNFMGWGLLFFPCFSNYASIKILLVSHLWRGA
jgi:hypothetical protein